MKLRVARLGAHWAVVDEETGEIHGLRPTRRAARKQKRARKKALR